MSVRFKAIFASSSLALCACLAASASAETREEAAARFGIRASVLDISLSPSGDKVAFISAGPRHSEVLNIIDLRGDSTVRPVLNVHEDESDLEECDWATDSRLVCQMTIVQEDAGTLIGFSRVFAVDADGQNAKLLTPQMSMRSLGIRQDGGSVVALDVPIVRSGTNSLVIRMRLSSPGTSAPVRRFTSDVGKRTMRGLKPS